MFRHVAHKICLVHRCRFQYDLNTSIDFTWSHTRLGQVWGPLYLHQAFWLDTGNKIWQDWMAQSVVSYTDTLGQLGCMWLACRTPSSWQWTDVRTMKLKDNVRSTVAWLTRGMCESAPVLWGTDLWGSLLVWDVVSSPSVDSVQSIQSINTATNHLSMLSLSILLSRGEKSWRGLHRTLRWKTIITWCYICFSF
jgi:hypothetical protein